MEIIPREKLVHPPLDQPPLLLRVGFLVGEFSGQGEYATAKQRFRKETIGTWEAGGQFLSHRVRVTYILKNGLLDVHEACIVVGMDASGVNLEARAYTDNGQAFDYKITVSGEELSFPDRAPGHSSSSRSQKGRARKILCPIDGGYDERLEVYSAGSLKYVPYSKVAYTRNNGA